MLTVLITDATGFVGSHVLDSEPTLLIRRAGFACNSGLEYGK